MEKLKKMWTDDTGFTLLEMVLVVLIIAALLLLFIPNISKTQKTAQDKRDEALVQVVGTQAELYRLDNNMATTQAVTITQLTTGKYLTAEQAKAVREMDGASSKLSEMNVTVDGAASQ